MDDIAHGLVVAAEAGGNHTGVLAAGAGEQDLAAAQDKGLRRAEASVERLLFGGREGSHMNWVSHVRYRTTFPIALLETALDVPYHQDTGYGFADVEQVDDRVMFAKF